MSNTGVDGGTSPSPGAAELAGSAVRLATSHYRALLSAVAIVLVPSLVIGAASLGYWRSVTYSSTRHGALGTGAEIVGLGVVLLGGFLAQAAGVHAATSAYVGARPDWRESCRVATARWRDVGATGLAVALLSTIGLAVFVVPGIVLWCTWFVAMPVVVMEGGGARRALRRSSELVSGRRVAVLVAYVLVELLVLACSLPVGAIAGAAFAHSPLSQVVAEQVAVYALEILLTPLQVTLVVVVYLGQRSQRDAISPIEIARASGIVVPGTTIAGAPAAPIDSSRAWLESQAVDPRDDARDSAAEPELSGPPDDQPTAGPGSPGWPAVSPKPSQDPPLRRAPRASWPGVSPKPPPPTGRTAAPAAPPREPPEPSGAVEAEGGSGD